MKELEEVEVNGEKIKIPKGYKVKSKEEVDKEGEDVWAEKLKAVNYKPDK